MFLFLRQQWWILGWLACLNIFSDSPVFIHLLSTVCNFLGSLTYLVAYSWFSSSIIHFFLTVFFLSFTLCQVKLFCEPLRWTSTSPPGAVWLEEPYQPSAQTPSAHRWLRLDPAACLVHPHPAGTQPYSNHRLYRKDVYSHCDICNFIFDLCLLVGC